MPQGWSFFSEVRMVNETEGPPAGWDPDKEVMWGVYIPGWVLEKIIEKYSHVNGTLLALLIFIVSETGRKADGGLAGCRLTNNELGARVGRDRTTVRRNIRKLEELELVAEFYDPEDGEGGPRHLEATFNRAWVRCANYVTNPPNEVPQT